MIYVVYGKGGSGKSLFQMHWLQKQLIETNRNIVTNLAILPDKFDEWMRQRGVNNLRSRLRLLTEEEAPWFWRYRGPKVRHPETGEMVEPQTLPGWVDPGCANVVDEAGACGFSSKAISSASRDSSRVTEFEAYLDQQRKHADDVLLSTNGRVPTRIAPTIRATAHYFIRLTNGYQRSVGKFRARACFRWTQFDEEPTGSHKLEPCGGNEFKFNGIENCYLTAKGVGVLGSKADIGQRAKGVHVYWAIPGSIALVALPLIGFPLLGVTGFKWWSGSKTPPAETALERQEGMSALADDPLPFKPRFVKLAMVRGAQYWLYMSDGSVVRSGVKSIGDDGWITLDSGEELPVDAIQVVPMPRVMFASQ